MKTTKTDKGSKELVQSFLSSIGLSSYDFDDIDQYKYIDLSCTISDKRVAIEVKEREYNSDAFGDILIEKQKVDKADNDENFDIVLAVNIYKDNILAISNIKNGYSKWLKCPETSYFDKKEYVWKECWILPQSKKYQIKDGKFIKIN